MNDPEIQLLRNGPPTLQKLCLKVFLDNCMNKKFKWDPTKVNYFVGKMIWDATSVTDLIRMASYYNSPTYFSRIIQAPTTLQMTFSKTGDTKRKEACEAVLKFADKADLTWSLIPHKPSREVNGQDNLMTILRINKKNLRTVEKQDAYRNKLLVSSLTKYRDTRQTTIEWICKFFHCDITSFRIFADSDDVGFEPLLSWPRFIEARSITIDNCGESDFLCHLVQERSSRNLKLTLSRVNADVRLNVDASCVQVFDLNFDTIWREKRSTVTLSDPKEVKFFMLRLCDQHRGTHNHDAGLFAKVMIPNLKGRHLGILRRMLKLKWRDMATNWNYVIAKETIFEHSWTRKPTMMYSTNNDGTLLAFYFLKNETRVYDQMVIYLLREKHTPDDEPVVITLD